MNSQTTVAQNPVGIFDNHMDIGNPKLAGSATYDSQSQTYYLSGAGSNIWFNKDEFQFVYKKLQGDFILTANFAFTGDTAESIGHRKIGWMIRESTDADAASINACKHINGLVVLQWRPYKGMFMRDPEEERFFPKQGGQIIQLERIGHRITMKMAHPGEPLQLVGYCDDVLKGEVFAGIYICSHDSNTVAHAKVWNVRIDVPVIHPYTSNPHAVIPPLTEKLGSRLEILDVANGDRKVIYEAADRFEAPNWMPDGKHLLFNEGGSLYTIPVEGGGPKKLNTGTIDHNNNDHAISFNGKMLGISSHRDGMPGGGSTVYTLPLSGGQPTLITENTPSYLHGWNPNGKELAFVGKRNGSAVYNLYRVNLSDHKETALTAITRGHVDGPEYSPDGKWIYYNANASGTMQIWRMKPDGSDKQALTFDQYNNWFPHISPDGKWLVMLSYPYDIDPGGHPPYEPVMIRLMPLTEPGAPKVIAYLYGGQGTINAPSWAPDSRYLAFVSNSVPVP
ncbi:MAG: TolB family protein [Bacteroidota bacterium]|nr:TolB family protein [Bacteroidota bacterium]